MSERSQSPTRSRHLVHPWWIWAGVAVVIVGMIVVGLEMTIGTTRWTLVGAAVIVVGLLVSWRGGIMYDVHADKALRHELKEIVEKDIHQGIAPTDQNQDKALESITQPNYEPASRTLEAETALPTPALAPLGVMGLLILATWLLIGQWIVRYPHTANGYTNGKHDQAFAIVLALSAIWMRQIGPNLVASVLCMLCGVLLVVLAFTFPHDDSRTTWNEIIAGGLVLISAALTLSRGQHHGESPQ